MIEFKNNIFEFKLTQFNFNIVSGNKLGIVQLSSVHFNLWKV